MDVSKISRRGTNSRTPSPNELEDDPKSKCVRHVRQGEGVVIIENHNGGNTTTIPPRSHSHPNNSSPQSSFKSRKASTISDYLCGLPKKKLKDGSFFNRNSPMSKSHFYCSPASSSSSSPSPPSVSPVRTLEKESADVNKKPERGRRGESIKFLGDSAQLLSLMTLVSEKESESSNTQKEEEGGMEVSSPDTPPLYFLTVHIIKGSNLVVRDANGSSDPYVKVKIGNKNIFKSKVIYANLNPIWDEVFTIPVQDINDLLTFKVVDYDWAKDDFMGMCLTNLKELRNDGQEVDLTLTLSAKGLTGEKSMGDLSVALTLTPRTPAEQQLIPIEYEGYQAQRKGFSKPCSSNGVLTVLLLGLKDLPTRTSKTTDRERESTPVGYSNVFAKLRIGNQKRRSKQLTEVTSRPEWFEQFEFFLFEPSSGQSTIFEMDFFEELPSGRILLGSISYDVCQNIEKDKTTEFSLRFANGLGTARVAMTITGIKPNDVTPVLPLDSSLMTKYSLGNSLKLNELRNVGHLRVKVVQAEGLRAADLGGKSDPFCVLELVKARVQTHTEYKTLSPTWNKSFDFEVYDITSILEVTVYDEDRDHKRDFLGKINIPLWEIQNGEAIWYQLKSRNLAKGARGNNPQILLQMNLIWNPIRAAIRVTDPQDKKYFEPKPQLRIETFLVNMERLRLVLMDLYDIWLYVKSCLDWEYPDRSLKALTFYLLTCYFFQPYFIPLYCFIYWIRPFWKKVLFSRKNTVNREAMNSRFDDKLTFDASEDEEEDDIRKMSLVEKFTVLQDASGVLQELVGEVAAICESTVNTYHMVVPFIYWLFALAFAAATILLFFVDIRYVAMLFGIHEFSRIYLRPWKKSSFEFYHMIRRVPHKMNMGDKLGLNSVLKSIQQLKNSSPKDKFWKRKGKSPPSNETAWYVQSDGTPN